mmetsp:Transcript_28433/g.91785  ORF Transcript_28433/g.91785 Transcript_28433/m.91785 type:complete len:335 (-) Transcript_28433:26-1030(-)|eukprot:scaffold21812_cov110-Isochrysis_galbana.AAC.8
MALRGTASCQAISSTECSPFSIGRSCRNSNQRATAAGPPASPSTTSPPPRGRSCAAGGGCAGSSTHNTVTVNCCITLHLHRKTVACTSLRAGTLCERRSAPKRRGVEKSCRALTNGSAGRAPNAAAYARAASLSGDTSASGWIQKSESSVTGVTMRMCPQHSRCRASLKRVAIGSPVSRCSSEKDRSGDASRTSRSRSLEPSDGMAWIVSSRRGNRPKYGRREGGGGIPPGTRASRQGERCDCRVGGGGSCTSRDSSGASGTFRRVSELSTVRFTAWSAALRGVDSDGETEAGAPDVESGANQPEHPPAVPLSVLPRPDASPRQDTPGTSLRSV